MVERVSLTVAKGEGDRGATCSIVPLPPSPSQRRGPYPCCSVESREEGKSRASGPHLSPSSLGITG